MKWAFIDYENIGSLEKIDLYIYEKVFVFLGAKQPRLDFGDKKYDSPINFIIIQIKTAQANNLDFHLSYYLGKYNDEAASTIEFDVISNDNGFSPLIAHIRANGRMCKQIKLSISPHISEETIESDLITKLKNHPKEKRPQSITSLKNYIGSHMGVKNNELVIQNHLNHLINKKIITVSGNNVTYK